MRPSHLILLLLVAATLIALVPPRFVEDPRGRLLMTTWGMPFEDGLFRDLYARGFERLHPGLTVQYQRYFDVMPKYEAWHAVGRGADVMRVPINYYHSMVAKGMLAPLDTFIADPNIGLSAEEQADFFPAVWDAVHIDGHVYALPADSAQYGVYYNPQLFDAYNAAHPDTPLTYPSAEWTWDDLRRAAEVLTITAPNGEIQQYGVSFDLWAWPFMTFLVQAGGRVWDDDQMTALIASDAGVEALDFLVSLIPKNAPLRSIEMADSASGPDDLFKVGRLAILLDGSWRAPNIELSNPDLDFAIAPLPRYRQRAVVCGSVLWGVSAHSRNQELAWEMVKWLTRREQALQYWDTLRVAPPALLSVLHDPAFRETHGIVVEEDGRQKIIVPPMPREKYATRAAWLQYAVTPDPQTGAQPAFLAVAPYEADLELKLARALVETVRGEKPARRALEDAVRETHALIDRDRAAKGLPPVERAVIK